MVIKLTKEEAINKLKELNYKIVNEEEYLLNEKLTTNYRTEIQCLTHNYIWKSTIGEAYRKAKYCNTCRIHDNKTWIDHANDKNYKILNIDNDNATFQCEYKHTAWTTKKSNIAFTSCKECNGKITLEMVLNKLNKLKFELLNKEEYQNSRTIGEFKCSRDHIWKCQIHNVYSGKSECPECSTNMGEAKCKFILETIFNKKFIKTRKIIDNGLELDMYNEELNLALEYNGIMHYKEDKKFFHKYGGFEEQQQRDQYKLQFCLDNNINLIIVPYTVKGSELVKFIVIKLLEFNYNIEDRLDLNWDNKFTEYTMNTDNKNEIFNKMKQYAIDKKGLCLETHYLGYEEKHRFQCVKGHKFKFDGREFIRRQTNGSFCVYCDGKKVDYEYLVELLEDVNMRAISTEYIDCGTTPFTIACNECNTEFTSVWDNLKQRQVKNGCNNCKKEKAKLEKANAPVTKTNKKLVSDEDDKRKNNPIYMIDIETNEAIRKYQNATKAGNLLNIDHTAISKVLKGKSKTYANYKWLSQKNLNEEEILKFENDLITNVDAEIIPYTQKIRDLSNSELTDRTVIQISVDNVFIKEYTYDELKAMIKRNNYSLASIHDVLDSRRDSVYNYMWRYKEKLDKATIQKFKSNTHKIIKRKVYTQSAKQKVLLPWETIGTIIDVCNLLTQENETLVKKKRISALDIINCCEGYGKYANGYFWSYE